MRVLIGFDGSEGARDAVALARLFWAGGSDAALLVNVLPHGGPSPAAYRLSEHQEPEESKRLLDSVAEALLQRTPIPTVAAPRGYAQVNHFPFGVIGVAYNGSPESRLALAYAREAAAQANAAIRVLSVDEPMAVMPGVAGYTPPPPIDTTELIGEALETLDDGLRADGRRLCGPVASSLAKACEDGVDILVAGSRGYGPAGRILLGSVSTKLVHKAPCPVLVVPRGKRSSEVARPQTASAIQGG